MRYFVLFLILLICSFLQGQNTIDLEQNIILNQSNYSVEELVDELSLQSNTLFSYSSTVIAPEQRLILRSGEYKLKSILDQMSEILGIRWTIFNNKILFLKEELEEEFWIYGYLRDESSGEVLINASVYNLTDKTATETNQFGYYAIKVSSKNPRIKFSYVGYESRLLNDIDFNRTRFDFGLRPNLTIPEIIVTPQDSLQSVREVKDIFDQTTKSINPGLFGEDDVLQSIKFLPGVQSGSELQGNILVRGGGADQNLILMDGVPLYEANHLLGLTSIFNDDAVNNVELSTSAFSSRHAGRLSSVIDVSIKDGNKFRHKGSASIGLLGAKIHLEGPVVKETTSYNFAARSSYINFIIKPLANEFLNINQTNFGYRDLNAKIHHKLTENSSLSLSTYLGNDIIGFQNINRDPADPSRILSDNFNSIQWQNNIVNFRFNQILKKKLFFTISASTIRYALNSRSSNFSFEYEGDSVRTNELDVIANSLISDWNVRTDWTYKANEDHDIIFGAGVTNHVYNPSVISREFIDETPNIAKVDGIPAVERFLYLEDQLNFNQNVRLVAGVNLSQFEVEEESFSAFQPRASLIFFVDKKTNIALSVSKMTQFVHLLVNPGTGLPSDLWVPSTDQIPPEQSLQFNIKLDRVWNDRLLSNIGVYYKQFENLIEYQSAFPLYNPVINDVTPFPIISNARDWEDRVEVGNGLAYGVDIFNSYQSTRWFVSTSYSFSFSNRQFENLNKGRVFPFKYDRRHDLALSARYRISKNWESGLNWVFGSGHNTTFATNIFRSIDGELIFDFSDRNGFQLPDYHRLDINVRYYRKFHERLGLECTAGIYNAYNRLNPYFVYVVEDKENDQFNARQLGIFPVLPFFNLRINY